MFVMSASERIERSNDPDCSPGPRLYFSGCPLGNIVRVRDDLGDQIASRLLVIGAEDPPWRDPDVLPQCLGKLIDVLSIAQPVATVAPHVIYRLPNRLSYEHPATIVRGDSAEGAAMLARFAERGLPQAMLAAGFKGVGDFWEPWCVAVERQEIAAIAFAARLGDSGAEIGVYTFPNFRARGFAAAVTASWSSMPSLDGRALFYSTARSNRSSQRVAERLGLRMIGASVSIG
ncbi:MAG: GNAT family N-acetyltransferase [Candidatus Binataceae bacterium]